MSRALVVLLVLVNAAVLIYALVRLDAAVAKKAAVGALVTDLREQNERTVHAAQATTAQLRKQLGAVTAELERIKLKQAQQEEERAQRQAALAEAEKRVIAKALAQVSQGARSSSADTATEINIINRDPEQVYSIYWLDYQGAPVLYATLEPGQAHVQPTFVSHPWAFINQQGVAVKQVFIPRNLKHQTVVLKGTDFQLIDVEVPDKRAKPTTPTGTNEF